MSHRQVRGLLTEYGIVIAQSIHQCRRALPLILEEAENGLSSVFVLCYRVFTRIWWLSINGMRRFASTRAGTSVIGATGHWPAHRQRDAHSNT